MQTREKNSAGVARCDPCCSQRHHTKGSRVSEGTDSNRLAAAASSSERTGYTGCLTETAKGYQVKFAAAYDLSLWRFAVIFHPQDHLNLLA